MPAPYGSCCTILLYFFKVLCCKIKNVFLGFPGGIVIKNLPCNAGDTALIPDFPQTVKCLPTVRETWVQSLGREDVLEKEMATHSSILAWKIPGKNRSPQKSLVGYSPWGRNESDMTEWPHLLSLSRKILHAVEQLSPCVTVTEPDCPNCWSPCALEPTCYH